MTDPLAEGMAGPTAVANSRRRAQASGGNDERAWKAGMPLLDMQLA